MRSGWLLAILLSASVALAEEPRLYAVGTAKVDITPTGPILLSGYASRGLVEFDQVEQRLYARVVVIGSDEEKPAALISVDNCGAPAELRRQVVQALQADGIQPERVTVSSTHTHAGPMLTGVLENLVVRELPPEQRKRVDSYTKSLVEKMIAAVRQALKNRQPARLSFGIGKTGFAINRRTAGGPTDHAVPVLRAVNEQGQICALVVGYACHCTALLGVPYISGDWAGYSSEYLEETFPQAVALTIIGCGADQNPAPRGMPTHPIEHGRLLAEEVKRVLKGEMRPLTQPVACAFNEISLDFAPAPAREEWEARAKQEGINGFHARQMLTKLDRGEKPGEPLAYPIQTWTFGGELAFVFLANEIVVDYSLRLKRELNSQRLWVAGYCNDVRCYVPSERVLKEGGYEGGGAMVWYGWPGPFAPGLEDKIIAEVHRQLPDGYEAHAQASPEFRAAVAKLDPAKTGNTLPLSPPEAVAALKTHDSLRVELVAAEPLAVDPVAIDWAPDGSLWVAEMHDYPEGLDGKYAPGGRVKLLRDTDGDGEYDRGTIFLDGIPFPTGVTNWGRGMLVCAAPDVIYAEDTNGDDVADTRQTMLTGFVTHNYQARVNSLSYGLDNWLYAAAGIFGGVIQTPGGQTVDVSNRDFRFLPGKDRLEPVSGRTQQGRVRDDFGNWFGCNNGTVLMHYPATERYFRRNPQVIPPAAEISLGAGPLFPPAGLVTFELTGPPGRATSACGLGIYRDTLLGEEYAGNTFTCEPVNQLVHRLVLEPSGATFRAKRAETETDREFLTSNDPWFRPVQVRTGPDGALYVVDMCRYVIEHPRWIPPATRNALDLRAGDTLGRIYRILPKQGRRRPVPDLSQLEPPALAAALDTPNGTLRDLVQHLLVEKNNRAAVAPLERLTKTSAYPAVRLQALHTLAGLGGLSDELLLSAMQDKHAEVRRQAIRLAETRLDQSPALQRAMLDCLEDEYPPVRLQLAYSLGEWDSPQAAEALAKLALSHPGDVYLRSAVLSSATPAHLPAMLARVLAEQPPAAALADELLDLALRQGERTPFDALVLQVADNGQPETAWRFQALAEIVRAAGRASHAFQPAASKQVEQAVQSASPLLEKEDAPLAERIAAVRFYAAARPADLERFAALLTPRQPAALQLAVIQALGEQRNPASAKALLSQWESLSPANRKAVLETTLTSDAGTQELLAALAAGTPRPGELDATQRDQLLSHPNEKFRQQAAKALDSSAHSDRAAVIQRYRESQATGDAARGKQAFAKHCSVCHRLEGVGHVVGPDLAALTNRTREALLVAILDPSRDVDQRYAGYVALTTDGRTFTGILAAESGNAITLKAQEGKELTILRTDLEILRGTGKSMMPEGIERDIAPAVLADLVAYLSAGSGLPYRYAGAHQPDPLYADRQPQARLTDGIVGSGRFNDGHWVGVRGGDGTARPGLIFDFGAPTEVRSIAIVYGVNHAPGGIRAPDQLTISWSENGREFHADQTFQPFDDSPDGLGSYQIAPRTARLELAGPKSRYLRLDFANDGEWTFLTEITFNAPAAEPVAGE